MMHLVKNKHGKEIVFEIAECYMRPALRRELLRCGYRTRQALLSAYETLYEEINGTPWPPSLPQPLYLWAA